MNTGKVFNICIAGCSKVAHLHAKAIEQIPNATLAGVWNRTSSKASEFARIHNSRAWNSVTEMVKDTKSDLVIVCTAHPFHAEPAIEAAGNSGGPATRSQPALAGPASQPVISYLI